MICHICEGSSNLIDSFKPKTIFKKCFFCGGRGVLDLFKQHAIIVCKGFNDSSKSVKPFTEFSKSALEAEKKTLMAHILADIGVFKSVSEAKKNGWDKPIEIGDHEVTKRKIRFRVVE